MKKNYFKPEFVAVEIACDSVMNETSRIPVTPEVKPSSANKQQGTWGDVWSK